MLVLLLHHGLSLVNIAANGQTVHYSFQTAKKSTSDITELLLPDNCNFQGTSFCAFSERTYCRDRVKACGNALAADLDACTNYTEWANEQCPKTCGICTDFGKLLCCLGVKGGLKTETRSGEVERCRVKTERRSGEVERRM